MLGTYFEGASPDDLSVVGSSMYELKFKSSDCGMFSYVRYILFQSKVIRQVFLGLVREHLFAGLFLLVV